jgi:hypothetical protein
MSQGPPGGRARVGKVRAIRAGAEGKAQMLAELGMVLSDPGYRLTDRAGHTDSSTLGRGRGSSIATSQANRARKLSDQEVALGVGLRGPLGVPDGRAPARCRLRSRRGVGGRRPWLARRASRPRRRVPSAEGRPPGCCLPVRSPRRNARAASRPSSTPSTRSMCIMRKPSASTLTSCSSASQILASRRSAARN